MCPGRNNEALQDLSARHPRVLKEALVVFLVVNGAKNPIPFWLWAWIFRQQ